MESATTITAQKDSLIALQEDLNSYAKKLKAVSNRLELKSCIQFDFNRLAESFIAIANTTSNLNASPEHIHLLNYTLPEDFKILSILHRDVFLELNKVSILKQENQLSDNQIASHYENSKAILEKKLEAFNSLIFSENKKSTEDAIFTKKIIQKVSLQKNPWEIYREQYDTLTNQIKSIDKQKVLAFEAIATFNKLKQVVNDLTISHSALVDKISDNENYILENTKEIRTDDKILSFVDEQLAQQNQAENKHSLFSDTVNTYINDLQKIEMPIGSINGLLSIRDIDLKKRTQKWFDYQILPEFMDLIGLETSLINKYTLNLINLKNSLQHSKEKHEDAKFDTIRSTLTNLKSDIKEIKTRSAIITNSLSDKVNTELLLTNLIQGKHFLDVTLNSSLNAERTTLIKKVKDTLQKGTSYFNSQYKKSLQYEALSNMELATQCIAHRMFQDESTHYDSLFLNKKFIGDLFLVPRKSQEEKLKNIVDHWNQGFNKSVLVTGDPLSGKSTFLDYSAKKLFGKDIVHLNPNTNATIDGRKFKTTYDLKEALQYVKNNNIASTRPVILIDDLELWRDAQHTLLYNTRALLNFIETESDDALVMASATQILVNHLDKRLSFSSSFSHIISVNEADENEITDAILLRHGAAHRDLITEDLKVISEHKIRLLAQKLSRQSNYNFGNTLQSWTFNTYVQNNENVLFKDSYYEFLDFFTPQEVIILKQSLLFTSISEYSIKNVTTTSYDTNFKSALRRLMNVKVLLRDLNGNLFINPVVVNDVTRIITNKFNS